MKKKTLQSGVSTAAVGIIAAIVLVAGFVGYTMLTRNTDDAMESDTMTDTMNGDSVMNDSVLEGDTETTDESMMQGDSIDNEGMEENDLMMGEVQVVEVEGGAFYYDPDEITVKKGDTVKIVLNSVDMMHDFVIDELNVSTPIIQGGDTGEVEFTVTEAGEYEFYCSVGEHRAKGMVGTLIVEE